MSKANEDSPHRLRIHIATFADGERFPLLLQEDGVPHAMATLFVTTQMRNASKAPNTILAALGAVRGLLSWAEGRHFHLEQRFLNRSFLTNAEIESLRVATQLRHGVSQARASGISSSRPKVVPLQRRVEGARAIATMSGATVNPNTYYARLGYIAQYLRWLGNHLLESSSRSSLAGKRALERMIEQLLASRPQARHRSPVSARRGLDAESQVVLADLVEPASSVNPFSVAVQVRNALIIHLLGELGIRAGELLALKVSDFDFQRNEVVITRRHGDPTDPRVNQPVVKTLDRRLPLNETLAREVFDYVLNERCRYRVAKRHAFLLVTHQSGPYCGQPLSAKGLAKICGLLRRAEPDHLALLSPHILRHTANDRFSELMDAQRVRDPNEEKMRSYWMGWREGSGAAATYTRRHIEGKAKEAALKLQERIFRERGRCGKG